MSTCYLALAIDEPGHFELGLNGLPLPAHHLIVVSEADKLIEAARAAVKARTEQGSSR